MGMWVGVVSSGYLTADIYTTSSLCSSGKHGHTPTLCERVQHAVVVWDAEPRFAVHLLQQHFLYRNFANRPLRHYAKSKQRLLRWRHNSQWSKLQHVHSWNRVLCDGLRMEWRWRCIYETDKQIHEARSPPSNRGDQSGGRWKPLWALL